MRTASRAAAPSSARPTATTLRDVEGLLAEGSFDEAARRFDVAALSLDPWRSGSVPA